MMRVLPDADRIVTPRQVRGKLHPLTKIISEAGLYTLVMRSDKPINVVMRFMGHTVIETTMRYAHLAPDSLEQAKIALEKE